jgi:hypothetical protein
MYKKESDTQYHFLHFTTHPYAAMPFHVTEILPQLVCTGGSRIYRSDVGAEKMQSGIQILISKV